MLVVHLMDNGGRTMLERVATDLTGANLGDRRLNRRLVTVVAARPSPYCALADRLRAPQRIAATLNCNNGTSPCTRTWDRRRSGSAARDFPTVCPSITSPRHNQFHTSQLSHHRT